MPKYLGVGRYTSDGLNGLAREGVSRRRATPLSLRERTRPGLGPKFFCPFAGRNIWNSWRRGRCGPTHICNSTVISVVRPRR